MSELLGKPPDSKRIIKKRWDEQQKRLKKDGYRKLPFTGWRIVGRYDQGKIGLGKQRHFDGTPENAMFSYIVRGPNQVVHHGQSRIEALKRTYGEDSLKPPLTHVVWTAITGKVSDIFTGRRKKG